MPIPLGAKAPRIPNWPALRLTERDLPTHFSNGGNIGLILGAASGGLVDIDADCPEAGMLAKDFLPLTGMMHGQASKAASHFWYIRDSVPAAKRFCAPDGACLVEIRSNGQMTILPPSVHPSGETYAFDCDDAPGRIEVAELCRKVARLAAAALLARHWPAKRSAPRRLARPRWHASSCELERR